MYNNYPSDGTKKICTITAVDIKRSVCKCISDLGEILTDVRYLIPVGGSDGTGSQFHPVENTKVLVDVSTGFPFILGAIPAEGTQDVRRPNIGRQDVDEPEIADYTTIKTGDLIRGPGTPRDQRPGDIVTTSDGGGMQGVLSSGTVISKASPLAQMICSRYGDVVRVVSRNFEHFTELDKTQKVSIRGTLYERIDTYRDPVKSRGEVPNIVKYRGNVQAAELIEEIAEEGYDEDDGDGGTIHRKYSYASIPLDSFPSIPEDDFVVDKTYVFNDAEPEEGSPRVPTRIHSMDIEGKTVDTVQTVDELNSVVKTEDNLSVNIQYTTEDSESTHYQDATSFHVDITDDPDSGENTVSIDGNRDGFIITCTDGTESTTITVNSDGTLVIHTTGNAQLNVDGNLDTTVGGNATLDVTGDLSTIVGGNSTTTVSGTTDITSTGAMTLTAPVINLNN